MLIYCLVGGEVLLLLVGPRLLCHTAPRSGHWSRQYVVAAVAALHCYKSLYSLPPNSCPHHWSRTQPRKGIFDLRRTCRAGRQPQHHHVLPLLLQSPCSIEQSSGSTCSPTLESSWSCHQLVTSHWRVDVAGQWRLILDIFHLPRSTSANQGLPSILSHFIPNHLWSFWVWVPKKCNITASVNATLIAYEVIG